MEQSAWIRNPFLSSKSNRTSSFLVHAMLAVWWLPRQNMVTFGATRAQNSHVKFGVEERCSSREWLHLIHPRICTRPW
ncbi:hypothetical protein WAI453_005171 [Rhynchosporium graminicola]